MTLVQQFEPAVVLSESAPVMAAVQESRVMWNSLQTSGVNYACLHRSSNVLELGDSRSAVSGQGSRSQELPKRCGPVLVRHSGCG